MGGTVGAVDWADGQQSVSKKQGCVATGPQEGEEPVAVRLFLPAFACESSFPKEGEGRGWYLEI